MLEIAVEDFPIFSFTDVEEYTHEDILRLKPIFP